MLLSVPRFLPVGDSALSVEFGDEISPELHSRVMALDVALSAEEIEGIVETVPSYRSLLVCYDPVEIGFAQLVDVLRGLSEEWPGETTRGAKRWLLPVAYDLPHAVDLAEVAERVGLTRQEVLALHLAAEYRVYMIGFAPGLPYLGGVPTALHLSRRTTPRPDIPGGAVMIGGVQACVVPVPVTSAWYMLGRTPIRPFDLQRRDPFLFRPGDLVRFRPIEADEFDAIADAQAEDLLPELCVGDA